MAGDRAGLRRQELRRGVGFAGTFLTAWFVLDRSTTSPPTPVASTVAVLAAVLVLVAGRTVLMGRPLRGVGARLGLGRPVARAVAVALLVGAAVPGAYLGGAAVLDVDLVLRPGWPAVLVGVLLFHGVAEELVWRGFVFGHFRRRHPFRGAVARSIPLIALTHVPIVLTGGWLVGGLAVTTAAVTCIPFAHLWERGGRTIWAPAVLHGLIGTWQLFEPTYPPQFSIVVLVATIGVPLTALASRDRPAVRAASPTCPDPITPPYGGST